jgi:predicted nucleic acid-binding protein
VIIVDTDIMVDVLRRFAPAIAWLAALGDEEILLPGFVALELIQGCRNRTEQNRVERLLSLHSVAWPDTETCDAAMRTFARVHLRHGIGLLDTLIGQMAVAAGLPLHTFNTRHYAAIPGLATVQPYLKTI